MLHASHRIETFRLLRNGEVGNALGKGLSVQTEISAKSLSAKLASPFPGKVIEPPAPGAMSLPAALGRNSTFSSSSVNSTWLWELKNAGSTSTRHLGRLLAHPIVILFLLHLDALQSQNCQAPKKSAPPLPSPPLLARPLHLQHSLP